MDHGTLVRVYTPALIVLLRQSEIAKVAPLTREEVMAIRDGAVSMTVTRSVANQIDTERGFKDIDPANVWEEWQRVRARFTAGQH
jgi:hypothetical protein